MKILQNGFSQSEILLNPHFSIIQDLYNLFVPRPYLCLELLLQGSLVVILIEFDAEASFFVVWSSMEYCMWCAAIALGGMLGQIKLQVRWHLQEAGERT